jgi:hypothetical protein
MASSTSFRHSQPTCQARTRVVEQEQLARSREAGVFEVHRLRRHGKPAQMLRCFGPDAIARFKFVNAKFSEAAVSS